jgi:DNA-nicking Smr family endonuclease
MGETQRRVRRHNVPYWLAESDLRAIASATPRRLPNHGGAGALYVLLRKSQRD